jgi:hypothetical protein
VSNQSRSLDLEHIQEAADILDQRVEIVAAIWLIRAPVPASRETERPVLPGKPCAQTAIELNCVSEPGK